MLSKDSYLIGTDSLRKSEGEGVKERGDKNAVDKLIIPKRRTLNTMVEKLTKAIIRFLI